jgi:glycosyltransferase involved in cell wall biosynthesis
MNAKMVIHGRTGFLADTPKEWTAAIARLAADPAMRSRMGAAGRALVEAEYSVARWAPRFAALLDEVGRSGGRTRGALSPAAECPVAADATG